MIVGKLLSLTQRHLQPEVMDRPDLEQHRHWRALKGLERIDWVGGSAGILWPSIRQLAEESSCAALRILYAACGAGDLSSRLFHRAARAGLTVQCGAVDSSPQALGYPRRP